MKVLSIGSLAVLMSSISLIPQVLSVFKKQSIEGISPTFLLFDGIAAVAWIIYGRQIGDQASVISSSISLFILALMGLAFYLYKNKPLLDRQQAEDDRFQYGGPIMSRGEGAMSMPGSHHFGGAQVTLIIHPSSLLLFFHRFHLPLLLPSNREGL